jgi:diguanylate cyclase (GGDEF)-like protein
VSKVLAQAFDRDANDVADLRAHVWRLETAVNNMSQGLLMFDAGGRMVICNSRYHQMYGMPPEVVKPGMTFRQLLALRASKGLFSGDFDAYVDNLLSRLARGETASRLVELPDGRTVSIVSRPMADGGWVVTHEDITERREAEKKIAHMARHDALTDLPNRVLLRERIAEALYETKRGEPIAVLYLDIDHFKSVNDTFGHPTGDDLLKLVAARLQGCVREHDTVARIGGDEFAIVQAKVAQPEDAAMLARRICETIRAPYEINGHMLLVDTSIGIAVAPSDGNEPDALLKNADMALYGAKTDGRGTYRFFEPAMDARAKLRRSLELALRRALTEGEFELHYQPVIHLGDDRITCCEALLRWNHPDRGLISPTEFVPIAEEMGLIVPLGEWVLRKACEDAARWPDGVKVAVNLSPTQVMHHNLVPTVVNALASSGLPAHRLDIEITESVLMHDTETTLAALHRLRALGVSISMDDFGTGYSSLSYLRSFPFDKIKIDRCFISGLPQGDDSAAIVRAVTGLARSLSMTTTAEGVETAQQMEQVRELGCTEMQGFYFSEPQPIGVIERLFERQREKQALSA